MCERGATRKLGCCVGSSGVSRKSPRDNADETRWMTAGGVNESEISLVVPAVDGGASRKLV